VGATGGVLSLLFALFAVPCAAQNARTTVFVTDFTGDIPEKTGVILAAVAAERLTNTGHFEAFTRVNLENQLKEEERKEYLECDKGTRCLNEIIENYGMARRFFGNVSLTDSGDCFVDVTYYDRHNKIGQKTDTVSCAQEGLKGVAASLVVALALADGKATGVAVPPPPPGVERCDQDSDCTSGLVCDAASRICAPRAAQLIVLMLRSPASGRVVLDGGAPFEVEADRQAKLAVSPGEHWLVVSSEGYEDRREDVQVLSGTIQSREVALLPVAPPPEECPSAGFGWVSVTSEPEDNAKVSLDGAALSDRTPTPALVVASGWHTVRVQKPLFHEFQTRVCVRSEDIVKVPARLTPDFGNIRIESDPTGARVTVDGEALATTTPCSIQRVQTGAHRVRIEAEWYHPFENDVYVDAGRTARVAAPLKDHPAFGTVSISITDERGKKVPGAEVSVDGKNVDAGASAAMRLPKGAHSLEVRAKLHKSWGSEVQVEEGKQYEEKAVLDAQYGMLSVTSSPSGAAVSLNGEILGASPLKETPWLAGTYTLRVESDKDHEVSEAEVVIRVRETTRAKVTLARRVGNLMAQSTPRGAAVYVDGDRVKETTPAMLKGIAVGRHTVRFELKGYTPDEQTVDVVRGKVAEVTGQLTQLGAVTIECTPTDAEAMLDGVVVGTGTASVPGLPDGPHVAACRRIGMVELEQTFGSVAGQRANVAFTLSANPVLDIRCKPDGAAVNINGVDVGFSPLSYRLPGPGEFEVTCSDGTTELVQTYELSAGQSASFTGSLLAQRARLDALQAEQDRKDTADRTGGSRGVTKLGLVGYGTASTVLSMPDMTYLNLGGVLWMPLTGGIFWSYSDRSLATSGRVGAYIWSDYFDNPIVEDGTGIGGLDFDFALGPRLWTDGWLRAEVVFGWHGMMGMQWGARKGESGEEQGVAFKAHKLLVGAGLAAELGGAAAPSSGRPSFEVKAGVRKLLVGWSAETVEDDGSGGTSNEDLGGGSVELPWMVGGEVVLWTGTGKGLLEIGAGYYTDGDSHNLPLVFRHYGWPLK